MNVLEQQIVSYLEEKYRPKAIILHGSRARGLHSETSDWDLYVLVDRPVQADCEEAFGQFLDVEAIELPVAEEQILKVFDTNLRSARILCDSEAGDAAGLLARAGVIYAKGKQLTPQKIADRRQFLTRRLRRIQANAGNPGVFFVHLGIFFNAALRYWFELKGEWGEPSYVALPAIKERDPQLYAWLAVLFGDASADEKVRAAEAVQRALFEQASSV